MADDRMFTEALDAIKKGQSARARDLLTRLLRADQNNLDYWLYMSAVVDSEKERKFCLENVIRINPKNKTAQRGMVLLGAVPPSEISPIHPKRQRDFSPGKIYVDPSLEKEGAKKPGRRRQNQGRNANSD